MIGRILPFVALLAIPAGAQEIDLPDDRFTGVPLADGATINAPVEIAALTGKEAGAGTWRLALALEMRGEVEVALDGRRLRKIRSSRRDADRNWIVLDGDAAATVFGTTVELAVTATKDSVIDAVRLFRLPDRPSKKLFGKPNGQLGPDGLAAAAYGFDALMVHRQPALPIIAVRDGSPAAKAGLEPGDVIVAIDGTPLPDGDVAPGWGWFERSHEAVLGRRVEVTRSGGSRVVKLDVLRGTKQVRCQLRLSRQRRATMLGDVVDRVVATQREDGSWKNNPMHTAFGGLALLSTGDETHAARVKAAADWSLARIDSPKAGWFWHNTHLGIFLCEYHLATGDDRVLPAIAHQLAHVSSSTHTSTWGTTTLGHGPKGLPYGNKSLVALTTHILVFEALAERCGVSGEVWAELEPYMMSAWSDPGEGGHGGLGYNASHKDRAEFWSRSGLFALALHMRSERPEVQAGLVSIMRERHPWFRNSHAYGEPGGAWGLIALAAVAPDVHREILEAYAWMLTLAWQPGYGLEYTTPHMGAPYMEGDVLINNAYAVVLTAADARLAVTGRTEGPWLDVSGLPAAASAVHIRRTAEGDAELACVVPGAFVHYTTDGSEPTPDSPRYSAPFEVHDGMTVKARAFGTHDAGPVAERTFGLADRGRVVAANGHADPDVAITRASRVLDGNESLYWVTASGRDAQRYPYSVTVDLGAPRAVNGVRVRFAVKETSPRTVRVFALRQPDDETGPAVDTRDAFSPDVRVDLPATEARYVRVEFDEPMKEGASVMMVGEIEVY